jgi:hypothetical protein
MWGNVCLHVWICLLRINKWKQVAKSHRTFKKWVKNGNDRHWRVLGPWIYVSHNIIVPCMVCQLSPRTWIAARGPILEAALWAKNWVGTKQKLSRNWVWNRVAHCPWTSVFEAGIDFSSSTFQVFHLEISYRRNRFLLGVNSMANQFLLRNQCYYYQ